METVLRGIDRPSGRTVEVPLSDLGSGAGSGGGSGGSGGQLIKKLTGSDLEDLYSIGPFELLPAPGVGKVYFLTDILGIIEAGTVQAGGNFSVRIQIDGGWTFTFQALDWTSIVDTAANANFPMSVSNNRIQLSQAENTPVQIASDGVAGPFGGVDSTLTLVINYSIVTLP